MNRIMLNLMLMCVIPYFVNASSEPSKGAVITEVKMKTMFTDNGFELAMQLDDNGCYVLSALTINWKGKNKVIEKVYFPNIFKPALTEARIHGKDGNDKVLILIIPYNYAETEDDIPNVEKYCNALKITFTDGNLIRCDTCVATNKERTRWEESVYDEEKKILVKINAHESKINPYLK